ncbi:Tritrans,polycis-undecaprenyl-diphosphate synthase (GGDP specific) [uncultured archaeon]|nr:Tritrans,polycis-undecaprenyl-diphosphate synthase (GGDP specific) [uncultured archaeon]
MENSNPYHVAIILDGNRRFAKRLMLEPWKGHEYGAEKVEKLLDYLKELGIKQLTLYCLSTENLKRPKHELDYLLNVFRKEFDNLSKKENREKLDLNGIKIKFIGNLDLLPKDLEEKCKKLEKQTEKNFQYIVNFAIAYGGKLELIHMIKNIVKNTKNPEEVNEELIKKNLYLQDEPDLIIRTGGEKRTSNFLPWQSAYSEWFFLDKFWPEFDKNDLVSCIEEFKNRKRNFGK